MIASTAVADPVEDITAAARATFDGMPYVRTVDRIADNCGADERVSEQVAYCTSRNLILMAKSAREQPETPYLIAHAYGHAVQVRHGVADFALGQIRRRRDEEAMLRGLVERQVDCIAGYLVARAGLAPMQLGDLVTEEPLTDIHWGRDPLRLGPALSIGLGAREDWFLIGQAGDLAACAQGEFGAELLLAALKP
ncbi:neutral zinc metallopeptidase [Loktanella agnita]|uniref:hypothetical protein n=1 Tax=Loktanella agnita TaxID=287097 RepID=UPI003989255E